MKHMSMLKSAAFCCALGVTCVDGGTVWDDAKAIYYNHWNDANSDGIISESNYEFLNERAPTASSSGPYAYLPSSGHAYRTAIGQSWSIRNEDVRVLGAGGITFTNEPCLHVAPVCITADDGRGGLVTNQMTETFFQFPNFFTGDRYTCLFRFKPEFHSTNAAETTRNLIGFGTQSSNEGLYVRYIMNRGGTGGKIVPQTGRGLNLINTEEIILTNNVWCDVAIIADYDRVTVGVRHEKLYRVDDRAAVAASETANGQGGRRFTFVTGTFNPVGSASNLVAYDDFKDDGGTVTGRVYKTYHFKPFYPYARVGDFPANWNPVAPTSARGLAGSFHTIGFWDRVLTREEINEFFSHAQRPGVMKAGPGGTGTAGEDWMRGAAGTDVTITNIPAQWRNIPATLAKGHTVRVLFDVVSAYTNLPQLVRISPAAASAEGTVDVWIDNAKLGTIRVSPGTIRSLFVPGNVFTGGRHTFAIARSDDGAGDLKLNCFEIKGSWQLGMDDGIYSQTRTRDDFSESHVMAWSQYGHLPAVPSDGWLCDIPATPRYARYSDTGHEYYPMKFQFSVDQDILDAGYTFVFETKSAGVYNQYSSTNWFYHQVFNDAFTNSITPPFNAGTFSSFALDGTHLRVATNNLLLAVECRNQQIADRYNITPRADFYRLRLVNRPRGTILIFH